MLRMLVWISGRCDADQNHMECCSGHMCAYKLAQASAAAVQRCVVHCTTLMNRPAGPDKQAAEVPAASASSRWPGRQTGRCLTGSGSRPCRTKCRQWRCRRRMRGRAAHVTESALKALSTFNSVAVASRGWVTVMCMILLLRRLAKETSSASGSSHHSSVVAHPLGVAAIADGDVGRRAARGVCRVVVDRVGALISVHVPAGTSQ